VQVESERERICKADFCSGYPLFEKMAICKLTNSVPQERELFND